MKTAFFICIASASGLFAVLPPLAQSSKEIKAILNDSQLYKDLGSGQVIQEIVRTEDGYVVRTQDYKLDVDVEYQPQSRPGPAQFTLHFHEPVARVDE